MIVIIKYSKEIVCPGSRVFFQLSDSLVGVAEGREGREFSFLTAWWMKLFVSLVVRVWRLLYLLPEGRRLNRLCGVAGVAHN